MDVMNAAQNADYKKLVVAGEPLNKKAQKIVTWVMLILMIGSVIVGLLAYAI